MRPRRPPSIRICEACGHQIIAAPPGRTKHYACDPETPIGKTIDELARLRLV